MKPRILLLTSAMAVCLVLPSWAPTRRAVAEETTAVRPDDAPLRRARSLTLALDNIFKQTIVLITDKYVHDEDDFAAGSAAVLLFENISKSGEHKVRLMDATGQPYNSKNTPQDDFEREAITRLKAGAKLHERVGRVDGKSVLRTVTPVPVVMKKCVMCHEHYADAKDGEPIGGISYIVPLD